MEVARLETISLTALSEYEVRKYEAAASRKADPYHTIRNRTIALADILDITEAEAEWLVLNHRKALNMK